MAKFKIEEYKGEGAVEGEKYVVKLQRGNIHPGVMSHFIAEALKVEPLPEGEAQFGYSKGTLYHIWVLSADDVLKLKAHMGTFTSETLMAHFKELRGKFPKKVPYYAPISEHMMNAVGEDEDEDEAEDDDN